jgi:hypothetical protein
MANLNENYNLSYAGHFIGTGSAVNLTVPFEADMIRIYNYTKYGTNSEDLQGIWFKDMPAGDALVIARGTTDLTSTLETTNGVTDASVAAAVTDRHVAISGATAASPVVITTSAVHGLTTGDRVSINKVLGMVELNAPSRNPYKVTVLSTTTFSLQDISGNDIDGSSFTAYSSGGQVTKITNVDANAYEYEAAQYIYTLGTALAGNNSDVMYFEVVKFGQYVNLGDAANF